MTVRSRTRLSLTLLASAALVGSVALPAHAAPSPTDLVADIAAGAAGGEPYEITVFNGLLYFGANDGVTGMELWSITGSSSPALVADLEPGAGASDPAPVISFDGDIYF